MKKVVLMVLGFVLLLSLLGCSTPASNSEPISAPLLDQPSHTPEATAVFDLAEYKTLALALKDAIMDESILLSNMGNYEYNYWAAEESLGDIGGAIDYDEMSSAANDWLCENAEIAVGELENNYKNICDQYKEIIHFAVSGAEAEEIQDKTSEMFGSFDALYLLVTAPSGDISDFADKFNEYSDDIKNNDSVLSTLLSD